MALTPGTLLWVKCDDGEWWPAAVREADKKLLLVVDGGYDTCVEFYHDPGNLYPLAAESEGVRLFHPSELERDEAEKRLFLSGVTQEAIRRALLDVNKNVKSTEEAVTPYTAEELRCMSVLLNSVNHETAAQLRRELLSREGINLSMQSVRQANTKERKKRKRVTQPMEVRIPKGDYTETTVAGLSTSPVIPSLASHVPQGKNIGISEVGEEESSFQKPFDPLALDVLRKEVFEDPNRFVLSPFYRYLDVLGAVTVDRRHVLTTLPSPLAICEVSPDEGFPSSRRVLLLALSLPTFDHTDGWMLPFEYEGTTIAMTLSVNDVVIDTPRNCALPSGKETRAVKTAPVADITDHVLHQELFSLVVSFTGSIEDATLWEGLIVAIYADYCDMDVLVDRILSNYQSPPHQRGREDVVGVQVGVVCPITTLPLEIPVRGFSCEHMQCVELRSLLIHCSRMNVWNCPLCWAPTTPTTIAVNYRLKDWLEAHQSEMSDVNFIVETPPGVPLRVKWKEKNSRKITEVISID